MEPIPLEKNLNWWWYKAKNHLLVHILNNFKNKKDLRILEIGPGLGNNISLLTSIGNVDVLEEEEEFIKYINSTYKKSIKNIYKNLNEVKTCYDLIVMLDVLEHIEDSYNFMNKLGGILNVDGTIILGVPAYQSLWSSHDQQLKHFRRYNWNTIYSDCRSYKVIKRYGLNYLLLPIRYIQIKINKITTTNESSKIVNNLIYLIVLLEASMRKIGFNPKFGISLYAVLKKKENK